MTAQQQNALIAIGQKKAELWNTPQGVAYADVMLGGARVTCRVDSGQFSDWLERVYYLETGQKCGKKPIKSAISTLSVIAELDGKEWPFFNRVGELDGCYYLDLGTPDGSAVKYSATGWEIVAFAPVRFSRSKKCLPLPVPVTVPHAGGELEYFYKLIGAGKEDQHLLTDFLVKCLIPEKTEPTLTLQGHGGLGASLAAEALKRMVDPFTVNRLHCVPNPKKLATYAEMSRVLLYEHFDCNEISSSGIDRIVEISKGSGLVPGLSRPQIFAYVDDVCSSPSLRNEYGIVEIKSAAGDRYESEFDYWREFTIIHPEVLGMLLDVACDELAGKRSKDLHLSTL
jgi:hypothetical protein